MKNSNILLLVEGQHEEIFINDFIQNHGKLNFAYDEISVIHANRIKFEYVVNSNCVIYFIVDYDDEPTNRAVEDTLKLALKQKRKFTPIAQDPEFGTFIASCFVDFVISSSWNKNDIKQKAKEFLHNKNQSIGTKKWTYSHILANGGHIKNSKRYSSRFKIIGHLIFNDKNM